MVGDVINNNSSPDRGDEDIHHLFTLKLFRKIEEEANRREHKESRTFQKLSDISAMYPKSGA